MRTGFLSLPLQRLQVLTAEVREKMLYRLRGLLSGRGVGLLRTVFSHIN